MAKIHPNPLANTCSSSSSSSSSTEKETFTVWMKSLVCHGNGCTVFNSNGQVAFRVDNYQQRCNTKAFLMDSTGNILFSLNRKKLGFGWWEGFKWSDSNVRAEKACFRVRRDMRKGVCCVVSDDCYCNYKIEGFEGKSSLKIRDFEGRVMAEATQKQSSQGVNLGDDVLRLTVEAHVDHSLVMALVTLYGLINNKL
ncbi:protein LURP-one-related 4-like [Salvia splendens]|uniref:protein LURP-one-related 4-like n=1 Tax=Salvia splendens TaxID=180675 RepID=UPI001C252D36|nr:protein LURP-one-related 4-like [Salvia splendens]